jgi:nitrogen fixation protein NifQ
MAVAAAASTPKQVHAALMAARSGDPAEDILARILASWACGYGAMPAWLGLGQGRFRDMLSRYFPGIDPGMFGRMAPGLDTERSGEMADLHRLLMVNRSTDRAAESLMADLLVAGCMGDDHLWQDLGLWQRADLSRLMLENFRPLALRNDRDMKWKKFLYKQLCETEGIHTCRAPSCEVCIDYAACFGAEE